MRLANVEEVDLEVVKTYARDLRALLEEADLTEQKAVMLINQTNSGGCLLRYAENNRWPDNSQ